jgi:hypothetical protein
MSMSESKLGSCSTFSSKKKKKLQHMRTTEPEEQSHRNSLAAADVGRLPNLTRTLFPP